ncbi:MAG: FG-GAP repeat domain-containing protein [Candidatus Thorarchaeota archaeon]
MKRNRFFLILFLLSTLLIVNAQILGYEYVRTDIIPTKKPSPIDSYTPDNAEPSLINVTFDQIDDQTVMCIDIGDADNDGDNDIVVGTSPYGHVVLYENVDTGFSKEFIYKLIANFSDIHGIYPVYINDVVIGDIEGTGNNSILTGSWYNDGSDKGNIVRFDKVGTDWVQTEILNGPSTPIPGGVYSITIGDIGDDDTRVVVVGEGGIDNLGYCDVVVYKKEFSSWVTEDAAILQQSRVDVCIGDFSSTYDGNEIVYCSNSINSTLGYVAYASGMYYDNILANYTIRPGHSPPYTSFMNVNMGDLEGDGIAELIVAVDTTIPNLDVIKIYNETNEKTIVQNRHFVGYDFEFGDFDNDGKDEIFYANTSSLTYPLTSLHYYEWNGTAGESIFLENPSYFVSSICIGDLDSDGENEMIYGTDEVFPNKGWLIVWDYSSLTSEISSTVKPIVSLFYEVPFSVNYEVRYSGWNTQNINITLDLSTGLIAQGPPVFIDVGVQYIPAIISLEWNITPFDYGLYNLDLTTNTSNAGSDYVTDSVIVTDIEVYNTVASSTTAAIGEAVTISGQIVLAHDKSPIENAIVYLNGEPVRVTDATGMFNFGITEVVTITKTYNITASLIGIYDFEDCAIYKVIEIDWVLPVSEFYTKLMIPTIITLSTILLVIVILKKKQKKI